MCKLKIYSQYLILLGILVFSFQATAQTQTEEITNNNIKFLAYLPSDYASKNEHPIIIFLHGLGERGDNLDLVKRNGPPKIINQGKWPSDRPFIVISPQLPGIYGGWPVRLVHDFIEYVKTKYKVDEDRIYLTGLSLGGMGTWDYVKNHPENIAAAVPICGRSGTGDACNMKDVPTWAFHGDKDNTIKPNGSIVLVNAINACLPAPLIPAKLTIYPGVGHDSWTRTYDLSAGHDIYAWMLAQSKDGSPPPPANKAPIANAGADKILTLPTNTLNIAGFATDADGTIAKYQWTKASGPNATLTDSDKAALRLSNLVEGSYTFRLSVTDNNGATASDDVTVTVKPSVEENKAPIANAGSDKLIILPSNTSTISGSATDSDGTVSTYKWTKISGPDVTMTDENKAALKLSNLTEGIFLFRLVATDDDGATGTDEVSVTVTAQENNAPIANAGSDKFLTLPDNAISLSGSGSDADGTIVGYEWIKVSGPAVTITNNTQAEVSLTELVAGKYIFKLTVTDDDGANGYSEVNLTVVPGDNKAPLANAGEDKILTLPDNATNLTGSGSDVDGTITSYEWTKISGPEVTMVNSSSSVLTLSDLVKGTFTFNLTVTDNHGSQGTDGVTVTVNSPENAAPTADAGEDIFLKLPENSATLHGSGADTDGSIASYRWSKVSGPTVTIANWLVADLTISDLLEGSYVFKLFVTDNDGALSTDEVKVTINAADNIFPIANAGSDKTLILPENSTELNGSGSDSDGFITTYLWTKLEGPEANIADTDKATLRLTNLSEGSYLFKLSVTDENGATAHDEVRLSVVAAENSLPIAKAGADQVLTLPDNSISLVGSASDIDGTVVSYKWSQTFGPTATLTDADKAEVLISNLGGGSYTFKLTVQDNEGATGYDMVKITVNAADNLAPNANAGEDKILTLPNNALTLEGSATDVDGTIAAYEWIKLEGLSAILADEDKATLKLNALEAGKYIFKFLVTDNNGATDYDLVQVVVSPASNIKPVVDAGEDKTITFPVNSIILHGTASDGDGDISSYQWSQISGPAASMNDADKSAVRLSGLVTGNYTFLLTVRDNNGSIATDEAKVTVNPAVNKAPTAKAGEDKTLTLPVSNITLYGSGSDSDGVVETFVWKIVDGPAATLNDQDKAALKLSGLIEGAYTLSLTVTDNDGAQATDEVIITVKPAPNKAPIANAGADKVIHLPSSGIILNGTASDSDGKIVSYLWSKVAGPSANMENTDKAGLHLSGLLSGTYTFKLTVTDDKGAKAYDDVRLTINNSPLVNAGSDKTVELPINALYLSGAGSDNDGKIVSYLWKKKSGPSVTIENHNSYLLNLSNLVEGVYIFTLEVKDDKGAKSTDDVKITVIPAENLAPVVDAGIDQTLALPINELVLTGSALDSDGVITTYLWAQMSGPEVTMNNIDMPELSLSGLVAGIYTFRLIATDNNGTSSFDEITITIEKPLTELMLNIFLVNNNCYGANEGIAEAVVEGGSPPYSYYWSNGKRTSVINGLGVGTYTLTVTDNNGKAIEKTIEIEEPTELKVTAEMQHESNLGNDGSIRLHITGGFPPYTVEWSNALTGESIDKLSEGNYTVQIRDGNGCFTTQTYNVNKKNAFATSVYPNPNHGRFNVKIENVDAHDYSIQVFDAQGTFVFGKEGAITSSAQIENLDITGMKSGFYFVKISYDNGIEKTVRVALF